MRYNEDYREVQSACFCPSQVSGSLIFLPDNLKMKTFSDFSLSPSLKNNLTRNGFVEPTPVQAMAIEPALAGRNLVATAQTGTGKTLAFVLPILETISQLPKQPAATGLRAIVLSPTRELAMQINETFVKMAAGTGIRASIAVGGLSENAQLRNIRN